MEGLPLGEYDIMSFEDLESAYFSYDQPRDLIVSIASTIDPSDIGRHGKTAVHLAAEMVDPEVLGILLGRGFRAGATDEYGRTPLHLLAMQNWEKRRSEMYECTEMLLSHRCPPGRRDDEGKCFYHIAAYLHNYPMIEVIGKMKIRCDATEESTGMNALHMLCEAAQRYDYTYERNPEEFSKKDEMCRDMAEWLVGCGIDPDAETRIGRKAVDFAISNRIKKTSAFLNGDSNEVSGGMSLTDAVIVNDSEAVSALLSSGADPEELFDRENAFHGMTPLMIACKMVAEDSINALLDGGADASNSRGSDGRTALYYLLKSLSSLVGTGSNDRGSEAYLRMLERLVEAQGSPDFQVGEEEGPAICFVAGDDRLGWTSDGKSVRAIVFDRLVSWGADIESRDSMGMTPLIRACSVSGMDSENIVSTLMELGADYDARDSEGMSAVMHASSLPHDEGLDLIRLIYDFCEPNLSFRNSDGKDAVELAAESDSKGVLGFLLSR